MGGAARDNTDVACRQTADTLQAAATFLELGRIWAPLDAEVASKIKFAKFHALRIAKALKAGEDPNVSNPEPDPLPTAGQPDPETARPDVQMLDGLRNQNTAAQQPSIEDVPDGQDNPEPPPAPSSHFDEPFQMPRAAAEPSHASQPQPLSPPEPGEDYYNSTTAPEVSPLAPTSADQVMSEGGGYFPQVPEGVNQARISLPDAPPADPGSPPEQFVPQAPGFSPPPLSTPPPDVPSALPADSLHYFPPPSMGNQELPPHKPTPPFHPHSQPDIAPQAPAQHILPPPSAPIQQAQPRRAPPSTAMPVTYRTDEEAVVAAQRHARFAISALNFEDVNTAVKELREALQSLGAG